MTMLERKTLPAAALKVGTGTGTGNEPQVELRFATFGGPDHDGDYTLPGAFEDGARVAIGAFGHGTVLTGQAPVGWGVIRSSAIAASLHGKFLDTGPGQEARTVGKELKEILEVSYSFPPPEIGVVTDEMRQAGVRRVLRKVRVLEVSMCLQGAGISTGIVMAKCSGCGQTNGAACSCSITPSRAEREAIVAESLRLLARGAKILAGPPETPEQLTARIQAGVVAVQAKYGCWTPTEVHVDPELRRAAAAHAAWTAARLGIVPPAVKFFGRASAEGARARGFYYSDDHAIWLRDNLRSWDLARTCTHECLHAARAAYGMPQSEKYVEMETEALITDYAKEVFYGK